MNETELLDMIEAYLLKTGESASAFGVRAVGDCNLVRQLRAGRSPTMRVVRKIEAAMKEFSRARRT